MCFTAVEVALYSFRYITVITSNSGRCCTNFFDVCGIEMIYLTGIIVAEECIQTCMNRSDACMHEELGN